jgi:hypothetical protein
LVRLWRGQVQSLSHAGSGGLGAQLRRDDGRSQERGERERDFIRPAAAVPALPASRPDADLAPYRHFIVADRHVGWVDPDFARVSPSSGGLLPD